MNEEDIDWAEQRAKAAGGLVVGVVSFIGISIQHEMWILPLIMDVLCLAALVPIVHRIFKEDL